MKDRILTLALLALACLFTTNCAGLSQGEQVDYEMMMESGLEPLTPKSPAAAAGLNILPGGGDIYNGKWGAFALDFLLWPWSIAWAVPQGAITANGINEERTYHHYKHGKGRSEWGR